MPELLLTAGLVFLFVANGKLKARIERLESMAFAKPMPGAEGGAALEDGQAEEQGDVVPPGAPADAPPGPAPTAAWPGVQAGARRKPRPAATPDEPRAPGLAATVSAWLRQNWFYAVSALSLALAGIFAAQYAADEGYLAPAVRIALAVLMGLALVAAGEVIRRRSGDAPEVSTAYLPSVFSGAGTVTLYGAVLSAQFLYGMIGSPVALGLLAAIAAASVALGWFYGPVMTAVGLIGATAAPFLVGGDPGAPATLNAYFGAVTLAGLAVNALRKWRWIDALAIFLPYGTAALVAMVFDAAGADWTFAFMVHSILLALAAGIFLGGALTPRLPGPAVIQLLARRGGLRPGLRQATATAAWAATVAGLVLAGTAAHLEMMLAAAGLALLFAFGASWSRAGAGALDLAAVSAAGLFALAVLGDVTLPARLAPAWMLSAAGLFASAVAGWRSLSEPGRSGLLWACAAAAIGPGLLVAMELVWAPAGAIGAMTWAGIAMVFAFAGTLFAERAARIAPEDRLRVSLGAVVASSMIALALFVMISQAALTVALGVLVLACVALDLRYRLPALGWFVQAGAAVIAYRAVVDPGLGWAMEVPAGQLALGYGLPALLLGAARFAMERRDRPLDRAALEGALAVVSGTGASVLVARLAERFGAEFGASHWSLGLMASVWLLVAGASLRSAMTGREGTGRLRRAARLLRFASAALAATLGAAMLLLAVIPFNPLLSPGEALWGVVGLSSLAPAYLLPGLVLLGVALATPGLGAAGRRAGFLAAGLLGFLYAWLSVAQAWRGNVLARVPMGDGELWTYTALLIAIGAGLLLAGLLRRSTLLRHAANGMLILAIAKVFLVDAPDLEGLMRAASFLVLGLALAGLAWINRRASMAAEPRPGVTS